MSTAPSSSSSVPTREDWNDADFDFPEGDLIHASDAEPEKEDGGDDEDWDVEMDLGKTGGAKPQKVFGNISTSGAVFSGTVSRMCTIRPPLSTIDTIDEDEDAIPTIKGMALPQVPARPSPQATIDEDFEDGFSLPSDLTRLSLRPLELNHRMSKSSLEWGDRDHTTSSQSSDAYSTFGFADHSPPSTTYTSASLPETETEEEEEDVEDLLDGLVVPSGLFESGQSAKLVKMLETKKKAVVTDMRVKIARPDTEEDFESGLVLDDVTELSPGRLLQTTQQTAKSGFSTLALRSKSVPRTSAQTRPQSRTKADRAKSPNVPPVSSSAQLRRLACPPSPPKAPSPQLYSQAVTSAPTPSSSKSSFLAPKYSSLRGQKSHTGLKATSSGSRGLSRKASLPSLTDHSPPLPTEPIPPVPALSRYNAPTASSKAKKQSSSTSKLHALDYNVPPTRPTTPASNPAALRLTMPTSSSRLKARPPISGVFASPPTTAAPPLARSSSPAPPASRPPSSSSKSRHSQSQSLPSVPAMKLLKKPKRQRTYGDGTELDGFEDLPLDREKEGRYRVQPRSINTRVPGATYAAVLSPSLSRKPNLPDPTSLDAAPPRTLKRASRMDLSVAKTTETKVRSSRKKAPISPATRRKPTLIRHLGGAQASKAIGEMKWNPSTLRWEGNEQVLKEFDAVVGTSIRPALITQLTGSSMGSPVNSFAAGARKVGNMIFDPTRMCWISTLPAEEDEPDVFADLADDEGEDDWEAKADTLRPGHSATASLPQAEPTPTSRARSRSESESDRCSRASMVCDVEDDFFEKCRAAEERHRAEMRGWTTTSEPERSFLYEIRALATRQY